MTTLSPLELDRMILSTMKSQWRKTSMIIGKVLHECEAKGIEISVEEIGERVIALDAAGAINSEGDLEKWHHSEVCLKPEQGG